MNNYTRISKSAALKAFKANQIVRIVPCKYRPDNMYIAHDLDKTYLLESFTEYENKTADVIFNTISNNFKYYNCNYETGYYPAYYIIK